MGYFEWSLNQKRKGADMTRLSRPRRCRSRRMKAVMKFIHKAGLESKPDFALAS